MGASAASALDLLRTCTIAAILCHPTIVGPIGNDTVEGTEDYGNDGHLARAGGGVHRTLDNRAQRREGL